MSRRSALAAVALLPALAACGARATEREPRTSAAREADVGRTLERNGVSVGVPKGWDARILFREPTGTVGAIFQVANFELPPNEGLAPPPEGGDRLKEMAGDDVVVTVVTDEPDGTPAAGRIGLADVKFLPTGAPRVPTGHALAEGRVCLGARCFAITVDFGREDPEPRLIRRVDEALASIAVTGRAIEADGLAVEAPAGWHGYATTLGRDGSQPVIWVANVPFREAPATPTFPATTIRALSPTGVVVEAVAAPSGGPRSSAPFTSGEPVDLERPPRLADGAFHADGYEGQQAPHVSTQLVEGRLGGRSFFAQVYFGRNDPTGAMRAAADAVLATLSLDGAPRR